MSGAHPSFPIASGRGQITEFAVWISLLRQSGGALQLFLPLNDRGVDGIVHHRPTRRFLPLQVKGRSQVHNGELVLSVGSDELSNPDVQIVLVRTDDTGAPLGEAFVFDVATFLRHSSPASDGSNAVQRAYIPVRPKPASPWHAHALALEDVASRIVPETAGAATPVPDIEMARRLRTGFRGELEFIRRPGPGAPTVVDPYRVAVSELAAHLHATLREFSSA